MGIEVQIVGESRTRRRGFSATFQGFQAFKLARTLLSGCLSYFGYQQKSGIRRECPKHNNVRVPRACDHKSIHAQTIITFVFQEHTGLRASMPKP